ncbi:MAG: HK97 family phage prohead protease [Planctomycetota bacterium]
MPAPDAGNNTALDRADVTLRQVADGVKGIDRERRSVDAVMSTPALDRYGERVEPSAFDLKNFLAAPRLLFNHDPDRPIGRFENVRATNDGLFGSAIFDTSPKAQELFSQVVEGSLNSFSVAWLTRAWEVREEKAADGSTRRVRVFTDVELLECSLVTIPANPEALIRRAFGASGGSQQRSTGGDTATAELLSAIQRIERRLDALDPDLHPDILGGSAADFEPLGRRGIARGDASARVGFADAYFAADASDPPEVEPRACGAASGDDTNDELRAWLADHGCAAPTD